MSMFELYDGVYILHEILGVKTVDSWNPKDNGRVIGVLVVEDDHKIVVDLEDAPENLRWSEERKLVNRPIKNWEDAEFDFNGEEYCKNLYSPEFPAAYYCLNYKKGNRNWYLPSTGELWMIYRHLEEIQTALSIVGGKKFVTELVDDNEDNEDNEDNVLWYWSSTEYNNSCTWGLNLNVGGISYWHSKVGSRGKVRPVSNLINYNQLVKHGNNKCEKRIVRFN